MANGDKYKYAVFSFIRHAETYSDLMHTPGPRGDELTPYGQNEAKELGQEWANVRIDAIFSSESESAKATAQAIIDCHSSTLKLETSSILRERKNGPEVARNMELDNNDSGSRLRSGGCAPGSEEGRLYWPPGGESLAGVVDRGILKLKCLICDHGQYLPSPPTEFPEGPNLRPTDALPDGVPHIVIVSHKVFLSQLHEALLSWNEEQHKFLGIYYDNTRWTRFFIGLRDLPFEKRQGYYQQKFRLDLIVKLLNPSQRHKSTRFNI